MGNEKHGVHYLIRTGSFPKKPSVRGTRKLSKILDLIRQDLIEQLGGPEAVSTAQLMQLDSLMVCKKITGYIQLLANEHGLLDPRSVNLRKELRLHHILERTLLSYLNTEGKLMAQLFPGGLGQRAVETPSLAAEIRRVAAEAEEKEAK